MQNYDKNKENILRRGYSAGSRAIDNYDRCCSLFGFKAAFRGNFAQQKMLYAQYATREGYSVWMLAHSSLNESFSKSRRWYNFFEGDYIKEVWFDPNDIKGSQNDIALRVCFAKTRDGLYVFQGIYKPEKIEWEEVYGKPELVRTFKRVSATYPIQGVVDENTITEGALSFSPLSCTEKVEIDAVVDHCNIEAYILEKKQDTIIAVDLDSRPLQQSLIGKKVGEQFCFANIKLTYQIKKIWIER